MRIDNIDNIKYKYIMELIENHLKTTSEDFPSGKNAQANHKNRVPEISAEVIRLLSTLSASERRALVSTWLSLNLPFDTKFLNELVAFLKNSPDKEGNLLRIKAFALLLKHKFPLLPQLIIGLSRYLNPRSSLTEQFKQLLGTENTTPKNGLSQQLPSPGEEQKGIEKALLNRLTIDMSIPPERLSSELREYSARLQESLQNLNNNPEKVRPEVFNQLLGQQLINNHDKNLLLALEIPFFFPKQHKLLPGYLQVWQEENIIPQGKDKTPDQNPLRITFLISLEKRGLIRADALYWNAHNIQPSIKIGIQCSSLETKKLTEEKIPLLQSSLEKLGLRVNKIDIELNKTPEDQNPEEIELQDLLQGLLKIEEASIFPDLKHIDFRV